MFLDAASKGGHGGRITLDAGGVLTLNNFWGHTLSYLSTNSTSMGGDIIVSARQLNATNSIFRFSGYGDAGNLRISTIGDITLTGTAQDLMGFDGFSQFGRGGQITLNAGGVMTMNNLWAYSAGYNATAAAGTGGDMIISAARFTATDSNLWAYGYGDAGSIRITTTGDMTLSGSATDLMFLGAGSEIGHGGQIYLTAGGLMSFDKLGVSVYSWNAPVGSPTRRLGGGITLDAGQINARDSGFAFGGLNTAGGGQMVVRTRGDALFDGQKPYTVNSGWGDNLFLGSASPRAQFGNSPAGLGGSLSMDIGGNLTLTRNVSFLDGGYVPGGVGGNVAINVGKTFNLDGAIVSPGGNISITAQQFSLNDTLNFVSSLSTDSPDGGGSISLRAGLMNIGNLSTSATASPAYIVSGPNGQIVLRGGAINLGRNTQIISDATQNGVTGTAYQYGVLSPVSTATHTAFNSGDIGIYADTINVAPDAIVSSAAPTGRAGAVTFGAANFNMTGGTIQTAGSSGGAIRIGGDQAITLSGGTIQSQIGSGASGDGNVYIGLTLSDPTITNAACDAACRSAAPYGTSWTPGTHFGFPFDYANTASTLKAAGAVGQVIIGFGGSQAPESLTPLLSSSRAKDDVQKSDSQAETPGISFVLVKPTDQRASCAPQAAKRKGQSSLSELLEPLTPLRSGTYRLEYYAPPNPGAQTAAALESCYTAGASTGMRSSLSYSMFSRGLH